MALLMRKAVLLAKAETTYGTNAAPTGAMNAILCKNVSITPIQQDLVARDVIRPFLGNDEDIVASNHVQISFEVELAGSGTAGTKPGWDPLMLGAGFSSTVQATTSVTYAPVSSAFSSLTLVYNVDGVNHAITGARGSVRFDFNSKGTPVMQYNYTGLYNAVTDTAVTGASYAAFQKPVAVNKQNTTTASLFAKSVVLQSASVDMGVQIVHRNLVGFEGIELTDRAPTGSLQFEEPTVAFFDVWNEIRLGNTGTMSLVHGSTAGNIIEVSCPRVQLTSPQLSDMDGISMLQVNTKILPNTGNDEISIIVR